MLALKNVLARADQIPTLIFDEIDQGIGGRVGTVVGQKLWQLGRQHQVLCVTHLPQLAAFGDQHLRVRKQVREGRIEALLAAKADPNQRDKTGLAPLHYAVHEGVSVTMTLTPESKGARERRNCDRDRRSPEQSGRESFSCSFERVQTQMHDPTPEPRRSWKPGDRPEPSSFS